MNAHSHSWQLAYADALGGPVRVVLFCSCGGVKETEVES